MTTLIAGGAPSEDLAAYHEARAAGGAALVIVEVAVVHPTGIFTTHTSTPPATPAFPATDGSPRRCMLMAARSSASSFIQDARSLNRSDGSTPVSYARRRYPMSASRHAARHAQALIEAVVAGYGSAAARLVEAGLDGVEIVASQAICRPSSSIRGSIFATTSYGGQPGEPAALPAPGDRRRAPRGRPGHRRRHADLGRRDEAMRARGRRVMAACVALDGDGGLDYFNIIAGSSATLAGSVHIVPPMLVENAYVAPYAAAVRARVTRPVFVAGRINQPQIAERVLAEGQADMCGMTARMICDPEMPAKTVAGRLDDIRACIACNQACIATC